jgi:disulfide oxidoreductase YuzD
MYSDESDRETDQKLKDRLEKKYSKFYYNVEIPDELEKIGSDDETDALEEISEDEYQDNIKELLDEDNK